MDTYIFKGVFSQLASSFILAHTKASASSVMAFSQEFPLLIPVASLSTYKMLLASGMKGAGSVTSADVVIVHPLASVTVTLYVPAVNPVKSSVVAVLPHSKP